MTRFIPTTKGKIFIKLNAAKTIRINDFLKKALIKTPEGVYYREEWNDERVLVALKDPQINLKHISRLRKRLFGKYVVHCNPNASAKKPGYVRKEKKPKEISVELETNAAKDFRLLWGMVAKLNSRVTYLETELGVSRYMTDQENKEE